MAEYDAKKEERKLTLNEALSYLSQAKKGFIVYVEQEDGVQCRGSMQGRMAMTIAVELLTNMPLPALVKVMDMVQVEVNKKYSHD